MLYFYVSKIDFRLLIVCFCLYGIYFRYVLAMCLWCFSEFYCIWLFIVNQHIYVQHAHPRTLMFFNRGFTKICEKEKPSSACWHSKNLDAAHVNETKHLTLHHDHHGDRHGTRWRFFLGVSNKKSKRCLNIWWIGCWNWINLPTLIWPPFLCACSFERMLNVSEGRSPRHHTLRCDIAQGLQFFALNMIFCVTRIWQVN